jgi:hypothetical protein
MNIRDYILIGIFGTFLLSLLIVILIRYFRKRGSRISGKQIEQQIDLQISLERLLQKASFFAKDEQYAHAVIYLFFYFRKYCKKNFGVKNAISLSHNEFPDKLVGYDSFSKRELSRIISIYDNAYSGNEIPTRDEYLFVKHFLENLTHK